MRSLKTWRENFFVPAREVKNLRAGTKKISRHFFGKLRPQSAAFWDVFWRASDRRGGADEPAYMCQELGSIG
ncbi:hypothetical protein HR09_09705 [Porphyromonas gulae]|nr:hypothetical protein HR09_09705 [Porphyromonas gulae]